MTKEIFSRITQKGIIPIGVIDQVDNGLRLCEALLAGGLDIIEITFRTAVAAETIQAIHKRFPEMLLGAGTLIQPDDVRRAKDAGAVFGVAPGTNPRIIQIAHEVGLSFCPGVCTPSDVEQAVAHGCYYLKFFPADAIGGVKMLRALWGPYGHLKIGFCPTGGISGENLQEYISLPGVFAVGGSWLSNNKLFGKWEEITKLTQESLRLVQQVRQQGSSR